MSTTASTKARVTLTAVNSEKTVPTEQRQREAFDRPRAEPVEHERADDRRDVRIEHRPKRSLEADATAARVVRPAHNSSLMRSKIKTLASTAIPIDSTKPAMPGSVSATPKSATYAKHQEAVHDERDVSEETRHAVNGEHEEKHDGESDERGDHRFIQIDRAKRRADVFDLDDLRRDLEGTGG